MISSCYTLSKRYSPKYTLSGIKLLDSRTLGRSGQLVFTRSDWLASKYILN